MLDLVEGLCPPGHAERFRRRDNNDIIIVSGPTDGPYYESVERFWLNALVQDLLKEGRACSLANASTSIKTFLSEWPFLSEQSPAQLGPTGLVYPNVIEPQWLFLGNRRSAYEEQIVRDLGITHIVDCHDEDRPPLEPHAATLGVRYCNVAVYDRDSGNLTPHLPRILAFVQGARVAEANARILVHCNQGISRSASCVVYLLMKMQPSRPSSRHLSFDEALACVQAARSIACPSLVFRRQVAAAAHHKRMRCIIA